MNQRGTAQRHGAEGTGWSREAKQRASGQRRRICLVAYVQDVLWIAVAKCVHHHPHPHCRGAYKCAQFDDGGLRWLEALQRRPQDCQSYFQPFLLNSRRPVQHMFHSTSMEATIAAKMANDSFDLRLYVRRRSLDEIAACGTGDHGPRTVERGPRRHLDETQQKQLLQPRCAESGLRVICWLVMLFGRPRPRAYLGAHAPSRHRAVRGTRERRYSALLSTWYTKYDSTREPTWEVTVDACGFSTRESRRRPSFLL